MRATWRGAIASATLPGHAPAPPLGKGSELEAAVREQGRSRGTERGGQDASAPG